MKQKFAIQQIAQKAGVNFTTIGIPQPIDVIKATSRDSIKKITDVNPDVLDYFTEAADELIALQDGDSKKALKMAMALLSGCHKENMTARSLLSGQENFITF